MRDSITFYIEDAREWDEAGMTQADQDALILGLWHWASGKPSIEGMSVVTKALYLNYIRRIEKSDDLAKVRSAVGKKGSNNRWVSHSQVVNSSAMSEQTCPIPIPIPTPIPIKENMGDTPMPPACAVNKKVTRFVKPTEEECAEVRAWLAWLSRAKARGKKREEAGMKS